MKPYLSLIIPYHNSSATIGRLVSSAYESKNTPPYEIIIVDDASTESFLLASVNFRKLVTARKKGERSIRPRVRVVTLKKNMGPAAARNRGAKLARGKFLVFLDSDVELFPDTLHNLARTYLEDPDVVALTGVWVKEQRTQAFFPNFKALRDWSYWINERDKSGYYFLFSTRIASIKKSVFLRLGGFDESYPAALVEDIELTYRIARRYAIIFAPDVRVHHEFESFWPIAKKYFWRSYHWVKLYARRKRFDPVATTWVEALTTISGVGVITLLIINIFLSAFSYWFSQILGGFAYIVWINTVLAIIFLMFLVLHIFLVRMFLTFIYHEKGLVFMLKSLIVGLILYCFIFIGAAWGRLGVQRNP